MTYGQALGRLGTHTHREGGGGGGRLTWTSPKSHLALTSLAAFLFALIFIHALRTANFSQEIIIASQRGPAASRLVLSIVLAWLGMAGQVTFA